MKAVTLLLVAIVLGCLIMPSFSQGDVCDIPREAMRRFEECAVENSPEAVRDLYFKVIDCLKVDSMSDVVDIACSQRAAGVDPEEISEKFRPCDPHYLGREQIPEEDLIEGEKAADRCMHLILPFISK